MKLVRAIKKYDHVKVANALWELGYEWRNPHRRPTNVEKMVEDLPRHELEQLLIILQR